jgi:hypothetical protein
MTARSDTGAFAIIPEWVLTSSLSDRAVRLYAILSRYADNATGECWPSRKTLADQLGCSLKSLDRAKDELVDANALTIHVRQNHDGQQSNLYTIRRVRPAQGGVTGDATPLVTVDQPPLVTGVALTRPNQELDLITHRRQRRIDPLFDAIIEVCGLDASALTSSARGAANRARADLAAVGATDESVRRAAVAYRREWPTMSLTPTSLAKHYPSFTSPSKPSPPGVQLGKPLGTPPMWELDEDGVARPVRRPLGGVEAVAAGGVGSDTGGSV